MIDSVFNVIPLEVVGVGVIVGVIEGVGVGKLGTLGVV